MTECYVNEYFYSFHLIILTHLKLFRFKISLIFNVLDDPTALAFNDNGTKMYVLV